MQDHAARERTGGAEVRAPEEGGNAGERKARMGEASQVADLDDIRLFIAPAFGEVHGTEAAFAQFLRGTKRHSGALSDTALSMPPNTHRTCLALYR